MAETMRKLGTMGQASQTQNAPNGNPAQIVNVTYGHNGDGKLYSYYGQNKRTGDVITPEVTHPKSGKTYKTLAVVKSTHNANNMQPTQDYLAGNTQGAQGQFIGKPANIKTIGQTDQKALPGYYQGWDKDAKAAYDLKKEVQLNDSIPQLQKLSLYNQITKLRK